MYTKKIQQALCFCPRKTQYLWDDGETLEKHEFILFLKPELTQRGVDREGILDLFFSLAQEHEAALRECILYPTEIAKENRLMEKNYHRLNEIAHFGVARCSPGDVNLREHSDQIFGGYQFLEKYPFFNPKSLNILVNNTQTVKLGYGLYASTISVFDQSVTVLNGFHPYQIETLTQKDAFIIVFRCGSNKSWKEIRSQFIGTIHPATAHKRSLRYQFWEHKKRLSIEHFSISYNGVHVSAGPLEAMHQYSLFFQKPVANTLFWKTASQSLCQERLAELLPDSKREGKLLYHLTEDLTMDEGIELCKSL